MVDVQLRGSRTRALILLAIGIALSVVVFAGMFLGWWSLGADSLDDALTSVVPALAFIVLGSLILWKTDVGRLGWLIGAMGLSIMAAGVAGGLADLGYVAFDAIGGAFWLSWILAIGLLIAWFPSGYVVSARWRWLQWLFFGTMILTFSLYTFTEEICLDSVEGVGCLEWVANPIGLAGLSNPEFGSISGPLFTFANVLFLVAVASLIVRFVRSKGVERQQLKWFMLAGALTIAGFLIDSVMEGLGMNPAPTWVDVLGSVGLVALPLSVILAIFRYRLYDIDRIISRTVTYAIVVALLAGVVATLAALVGTRFDSPLVVAATTLGVAAVFNPLRKGVQSSVDRRFNRSRYDAERVMDTFVQSLRDEVDQDTVVRGWMGVVEKTMLPASVGLWVRYR